VLEVSSEFEETPKWFVLIRPENEQIVEIDRMI